MGKIRKASGTEDTGEDGMRDPLRGFVNVQSRRPAQHPSASVKQVGG